MNPVEESDRFELPQFPLESAVLPSQVLSLHIFEPRYRQLVEDLLSGDGRFGAILITRGSEVGGMDQRSEVGTLMQLHDTARLDDGRWFITAAGMERYQIGQWLDDNPYPRAEVESMSDRLLADESTAVTEPGEVAERFNALTRDFGRAMAMVSELGGSGAPGDLSEDRDVALYQMSVLLPVGPLDKYKLLEAGSSLDRLALLEGLVSDTNDLLRFQLSQGDS